MIDTSANRDFYRHRWEGGLLQGAGLGGTSEDEQHNKNGSDDSTGDMPPENLRPPDLALDRLVDCPSDRDAPCPADRRYLEILHEESVITDGSPEVFDECNLVDISSLEDNRATPDLVVGIDTQ